MARIQAVCFLAAVGLASVAASFVGGCSGHGGSASVDPRAAADVGNPGTTVNATAVDPIASQYNVAWWEASVQDFSASDAYGNVLPSGEDRYALVFFGHQSDGTVILSGQLVVDATYADSLKSDATMVDVSLIFDGSDVYGYPADPSSPLPDADRNALLASVIDSFAGGQPSGGPSSLTVPPRSLNLESNHGAAGQVTMVTVLQDAQAAGMPCNSELITAGAVAGAESSLYPQATNTNGPTSGCPNGSTDMGVWQINSCYHPDVSQTCAFNPSCAASSMMQISKNGTNFNAWATYKYGAYKSWVPMATEAYNQVCNPAATTACDSSQVQPSAQSVQALLNQLGSGDACMSAQCGAGLLLGSPPNACSGSSADASPSAGGMIDLSQYNPTTAIAYADAHWQDGVGLCAEFASRSIIAGGAQMPVEAWVPSLLQQLSSLPFDEYNSTNTTVSGNPGDIVIYSDALGSDFCDSHSTDEWNCGHAGIVVAGGGSVTTILADFHNNAHYHLAIHAILGGSSGYTTLRVYHLAAGSSAACACSPCASSLLPPAMNTLHPSCGDAGAPAAQTDAAADAPPDAGAGMDSGADAPPPDASADSPVADGPLGDGPDPYFCTEHGLADGFYCGQNIGLNSNTVYDCSNGFIFDFGPCPPGQSCVTGQQSCQ